MFVKYNFPESYLYMQHTKSSVKENFCDQVIEVFSTSTASYYWCCHRCWQCSVSLNLGIILSWTSQWLWFLLLFLLLLLSSLLGNYIDSWDGIHTLVNMQPSLFTKLPSILQFSLDARWLCIQWIIPTFSLLPRKSHNVSTSKPLSIRN